VGYKTQWKKERPKDNPGINTISKEDFMKGVGGVWSIQPETQGLTMANFPVALPKLCIELLTFKDDVVLDPFMGSGTTAIACLETNRQYIGFELSPNYHAIAENRIANYVRTGNTTLPRPKKTNIKKSKTIKMANPDLLEFAQ
jgi:site-specific DNA-methyltransferase (adenine-specific)